MRKIAASALCEVKDSGVQRIGFSRIVGLLLGCAAMLGGTRCRADSIVDGINIVVPLRVPAEERMETLLAMKTAGVKAIRVTVPPDESGVDYLRRAAALGIKALLILDFRYRADAPTRAYRPKEFPLVWGGHPLSSADPRLSREYFEAFLGRIDRAGIALAGLELGNEINGTSFNADFPLPGEDKALGLEDLQDDPVGRQVAAGFRRYVEILAQLKEVRDHLTINKRTPIISAGLVGYSQDFDPTPKRGVVYESAAIDYLRAHGVDKLIDAYGIHVYPSAERPDTADAKARRAAHFWTYDLARCEPAGSAEGKPCWITEWGFKNPDKSCAPDERVRSSLIRQMDDAFRSAIDEKRISGLFFYTWTGDPWIKHPDPYSVFRCGKLTAAGRLAVRPLASHK